MTTATTPPFTAAALWAAGFRPFFLLAGLWAALALAAWIGMLRGAPGLPTHMDPVTWHAHELLFGFVPAAMAGFLLTAMPNWTGRAPLRGAKLAALVGLWLLGRVAVATSAWLGALPAALADLAFLVVLAAVAGREIVGARNWRNLPILLVLGALILANALMHGEAAGALPWPGVGKRLAIGLITLLISLIGGRIIPSFTGNWLRRRGETWLPATFDRVDASALALSIIALAAWVATGANAVAGGLLMAAGLSQGVRLARWRGPATRVEPLLWILHVGYAWIPVGLVLLGASNWWPVLSTPAVHALTAGAMGTMILAVMTRASLGHSGRTLTADRGTLVAYLLVLAGVVARLAGPFIGDGYVIALNVAAGTWIAGFTLFVALYAPLYLRR